MDWGNFFDRWIGDGEGKLLNFLWWPEAIKLFSLWSKIFDTISNFLDIN